MSKKIVRLTAVCFLMIQSFFIMVSCVSNSNDAEIVASHDAIFSYTDDELLQVMDSDFVKEHVALSSEAQAKNIDLLRTSIVLNEYLEIENDTLVASLSKEEALSKGVKEEYYTQWREGITSVNKAAREANSNGIKSHLRQDIAYIKSHNNKIKKKLEDLRID